MLIVQEPLLLGTFCQAGSVSEGRNYNKLMEVYSQSGDTAEFTRNFESYLREKIPLGEASASLLSGLAAFFSLVQKKFDVCRSVGVRAPLHHHLRVPHHDVRSVAKGEKK